MGNYIVLRMKFIKQFQEKCLNAIVIYPQNTYQILRTDSKGMCTVVLNSFGIQNKTYNNSINTSNFSIIETVTNASTDVETKSFRLISSDKWNKVKKKIVIYGNSKYVVLKCGKWNGLFA